MATRVAKTQLYRKVSQGGHSPHKQLLRSASTPAHARAWSIHSSRECKSPFLARKLVITWHSRHSSNGVRAHREQPIVSAPKGTAHEISNGLLAQAHKTIGEALAVAVERSCHRSEPTICVEAVEACTLRVVKELQHIVTTANTTLDAGSETMKLLNSALHKQVALLSHGITVSPEVGYLLMRETTTVQQALERSHNIMYQKRMRGSTKMHRQLQQAQQTEQRGNQSDCGTLQDPEQLRAQEFSCPSGDGGGWWRAKRAKSNTPGKGLPPQITRSSGGAELQVKFVAPVDAPLSALIHSAINQGPRALCDELRATPSSLQVAGEGTEKEVCSVEMVERLLYIGAVWVRKFKPGKGGAGYLLPDARWERSGLVRAGSCVTVYPCPRRFAPVPPHSALASDPYHAAPVQMGPPTEVMEEELVRWWQGRILYQHNDVIVVDKPAGLPCQPVGSNSRECVPRLLGSALGRKLYALHRLDQWTTGCLMLATSRQSASVFNKLSRAVHAHDDDDDDDDDDDASTPPSTSQPSRSSRWSTEAEGSGSAFGVGQHSPRKLYKVLTYARVPLGRLSQRMAPARDVLPTSLLLAGTATLPHLMLTAQPGKTLDPKSEGLESISLEEEEWSGWKAAELVVLRCERVVPNKRLPSDLIGSAHQRYYESEVELVTGRTHQIRAQLASVGAPLVGDTLYTQLAELMWAPGHQAGCAVSEAVILEDKEDFFKSVVQRLTHVLPQDRPLGLHAARVTILGRAVEAPCPWWQDNYVREH